MDWSSFEELDALDGLDIVVVRGEGHECALCRLAGVDAERKPEAAPRPPRGAAFGLRAAPSGQPEG